jgi:hypothetical protein
MKLKAINNNKLLEVVSIDFINKRAFVQENNKKIQVPFDSIIRGTEIKDINENEIFEKDILVDEFGYFYEVFYENGAFKVKEVNNKIDGQLYLEDVIKDNVEIVGNILVNSLEEIIGENDEN